MAEDREITALVRQTILSPQGSPRVKATVRQISRTLDGHYTGWIDYDGSEYMVKTEGTQRLLEGVQSWHLIPASKGRNRERPLR